MRRLLHKTHTIRMVLVVFGLMLASTCFIFASQKINSAFDWENQTQKFEKSGDIKSAKKIYEDACEYFLKNKLYKEYVRCITGLATFEKNNREYAISLQMIRTADSLYFRYKLDAPLLLGEINHLHGTLMIIFGNNLSAVKLLESAIQEKRKSLSELDTILSVTYNNLGMANSNLEQFSNAIKYINLAINSLEHQQNNKLNLLAKFHENLGITFARMGDFSKARDYMFRSLSEKLKLSTSKNDYANLASSYVNLGQIETTLGNLDSAFHYLNYAENLLTKTSNPESSDLDIVYNHKGNIYSLQGDYEKALVYYNKSLIMLRRKSPGHSRIKEIEMNIGHIYYVKQDYAKSVEYFLSSLDHTTISASQLKTYRNLGKSMEALGRLDEAKDFLTMAIRLSEQRYGKENFEVALSHLHYGNLLKSMNLLAESHKHYSTALQINKKLFGTKNRDVADCYLRLAELELQRKNYHACLQNYQNALIALVEDFNDANPSTNPNTNIQSPDYYLMNVFAGKGEAFFELYRKDKQLKDLYLSFNNYKLYASVVNQIRSKLSSDESNLVISSRLRELLGGALRTTTELYKVTDDSYYLSEAFMFAEKGKSAILLAEVNDREEMLGNPIPASMAAESKQLRNNIAGYNKLIHEELKSTAPNLNKIDLWREKVFALEKDQEELAKRIKTINPDYLKYRFGDKIPTPKELQQLLHNETILEYTLTNEAIYTFVVNPDTFVLNITPVDSKFKELVASYIDNIRHGLLADAQLSFNSFIDQSHQLYNILIKPNYKYLMSERLMIVPDGILGYIPFETLIKQLPEYSTPDYQHLNYLIKDRSIRYSYLASLPFIEWPARKKPDKTFVGFAPLYVQTEPRNNDNLEFRPVLNDIPGIRVEVQKIAEGISGSDLFLNENATEATFKKISGEYEILHLALHTLVDNDNPMFSKMIFSNSPDSTEDQLLNTYEIYNLDLSARLAVLSSCNTGSGRLVSGEGVMSLARGFLYAGVPSVVMTLWEAEDDVATGMMPSFYENLKQGQEIDQALHNAKLDYLASADRLRSHPYFWSSYVMIGANEPITNLKEKGIPVWLITIGIFTLLSVIGYLTSKKITQNKK
ncbi:MAG: hypothetical protein CVU06_01455 [Bacteroidetes bacterium HGW-Bacteroidetes-22]|nr:MAG: hypothetical protein CVU06_01455 [Bacteroidetes bacterium HGW-Bacteroidetes-22]